MEVKKGISISGYRRSLRDYIRLVLTFFYCLVFLAIYQNIRFYIGGVLDGIFTQSLFLSILHHSGYAALVSLIIVFLFKALEAQKPGRGFKTTRVLFIGLLVLEGLLTEYYVQHYEVLGAGLFTRYFASTSVSAFLLFLITYTGINTLLFQLLYRFTASFYGLISKMYPFTIILFSLFLVTLNTRKKPVNENKSQHLVQAVLEETFNFNTYEGEEEYPLLKPFKQNGSLGNYFNLKDEKPNIVFLIVDGMGSDFLGNNAIYPGFMPYLNSLTYNSLYWENHLSNTGEGEAALATILGSLPFGREGFTNMPNTVTRQTILGILKMNGYETAFYYGGNSALNRLDKFIFEEHIDQMIDVKGFGEGYTRQDTDAAGISLGYPDKELFRNWAANHIEGDKPKLEVFKTLSTKSPYLIPGLQEYKKKVNTILKKNKLSPKIQRRIRKNKELFASLLYTDEAIREFIYSYRKHPEYQNTIFVITGSHNLTDLPKQDELSRYKVPLLIYSPLKKRSVRFKELVSHADIVPALLGMLGSGYEMNIPEQVAWLGTGLVHKKPFQENKAIPLYRYKRGIKDYIKYKYFLSGSTLFEISPSLKISPTDNDVWQQTLEEELYNFKAVNNYVTENDKLIPKEHSIFKSFTREPSKEELVWINSVFNGTDFDNAYETARDLALDGNRERALLLCNYILEKVPGHADTEILVGRIHGWEGQFEQAMVVLERAVQKYPKYSDGYSALLDVYFWSGQNNKVPLLERTMERHDISTEEIRIKLKRAHNQINEQNALNAAKAEENITPTILEP